MRCVFENDFAGEHEMLSAKDFSNTRQNKKEDSMSSQKKKEWTWKETESYRLGFPDAGNDPDRMDELLSDDSGIHPVFTDRYGINLKFNDLQTMPVF